MPPRLTRRALPALGAALAAPRLAFAQPSRLLRFVPQSDLGVLDPIWTTAYVTRNHALMVFDMLYGMDAQYRIQPQMAEGHEVADDGLAWTIRLREGLRFHDGTPVLARDCVASIRRWGARDSLGQSLLAATAALEVVDDRTLRFRLTRRFPLLAHALGKPGSPVCAIMPERLAATDPFKQVTEMVGSGPFRFLAAERVSGARVAYARNPDYVPRPGGAASFTAGAKLVHLDRVEWQVIPDPSTAAAALQAGEVDWWENPSFDLLPVLARDRRVTLTEMDPLGFIGCLRFNHLNPPFDNPAIRRAVLPALRQADFMTAVAGDVPGGWNEGIGFFAPGSPLASDEGMAALTGPRDLDAARRALAAAGYRGERVAVPAPSDFPNLKAMADVGADLLKRIGFNVDYQAADWGTVVQRLAKTDPVEQGGWSVFHTFWSGQDMFDPAVHQYLRANGRAGRPGWPSSPALEGLRDEWMVAETEAERLRLARAMQRQAFEDLPYIPVGQIRPRFAHRREVAGLLGGFAIFWTLRKA
ncbi:ABC transporter substrate-binding protein [Roseicella aquatilis]|uniref:ABC transporter substrate-binding protein n=1 Tax=Roseicella aquatilis TaxID=2527868 RepID=A0A4R4DVL2_9PROT|nr:ABC transporter substrate-binding protein [Roseicella aquatilis]TCZ66605.1 ABC transporter substrate-binding protein [Roseicella aquatilis]